jgi:hypothetical protein
MIGAWFCRPQKAVADIAIPAVLLIAFISWRGPGSICDVRFAGAGQAERLMSE